MRILFIDPCNGHEVRKTLVEVSKKFSRKQLEELEALQPGRGRSGGDWVRMLKDGNATYNIIPLSKKGKPHITFTLTSGNY